MSDGNYFLGVYSLVLEHNRTYYHQHTTSLGTFSVKLVIAFLCSSALRLAMHTNYAGASLKLQTHQNLDRKFQLCLICHQKHIFWVLKRTISDGSFVYPKYMFRYRDKKNN